MAPLGLLESQLQEHHLTALGHCPVDNDHGLTGTLVLIGPDEPAFWPQFKASPEYSDGVDHALDRWSERVITGSAQSVGGRAVFPFGGPPYLPFYSWAVKTGRFWPSPIGFLVHDTAGLFVSFRGAIVLPRTFAAAPGANPCDSCADKPCQTACPVGAFTDGYDVAACKSHLSQPAGGDCMDTGCRARRACPVNQGKRLPEQAAFHMKAFL